jgi:hypothetical protein
MKRVYDSLFFKKINFFSIFLQNLGLDSYFWHRLYIIILSTENFISDTVH